jgi:transcriptional regulator with XRE-family HTH domain
MVDVYQLAGRRLRHVRNQAGMTQSELGRRVHMSRTSITNFESGAQKMQLHTLYSLAGALSVEPADLLPSVAVIQSQGAHVLDDADRAVLRKFGLDSPAGR